ncbi:hypothetical protein D3C87_2177100 [compost metagenome]
MSLMNSAARSSLPLAPASVAGAGSSVCCMSMKKPRAALCFCKPSACALVKVS